MRFDYLGIFGGLFTSRGRKLKRNKKRTNCPNCNHKQEIPFSFCPDCGQHARESKITFFSLIGEVFSNILNIDASLYRSLFWLPVPAFLSKHYINGERKQYLNPVRFFFFSMLLFFALLVGFMDLQFFEDTNKEQLVKIERSVLYETFENEIKKDFYSSVSPAVMDSMRIALFRGVKLPELDTIFSDDIKTDSSDVIHFDLGLKLLRRDLFNRPIDEIVADQKPTSWLNKIMMGQLIRVSRDFKGALSFFAGNGIWVFIAGIFFLSFAMKLLYIRKKKFLIEHSIILFHTHAFAFVVGIFCMLLIKYLDNTQEIIGASLFLICIYIIFSIKKYYQQGWFKTLIKFGLITFFYGFIMVILVGLVLLLSILFFN
ncbi:MAG: DUF3667 domain-containing protein [Saprospiraceae bacterium]